MASVPEGFAVIPANHLALYLKEQYFSSYASTGAESWPPGVCLKYVGGDQFGHVNMVMVRSLEPQEMFDVSVQMHSPVAPAMYQGQWRMCTATGLFFGGKIHKIPMVNKCFRSFYAPACVAVIPLHIPTRRLSLSPDVIWVILSVEVGGLLGVTQQLSSFQTEFNTHPNRSLEGDYNPFASPQKTRYPGSTDSGLHDDSSLKDTGEPWEATPNPLQQDQNGLSHNSVNIAANSLQSNLSVVTYNQVGHPCHSLSPCME